VRILKSIGLVLALLCCSLTAQAQSGNRYCPDILSVAGAPEPAHRGEFTFSPYTYHFSYSAEHKPVVLVALDEQLPGGRFCGISFFSNSFGQPSTYAYVGQQFNGLFDNPKLFVKVSGGIIYGYVGKYQNKVPLNSHGFSPGVIPSIGHNFSEHDSVQMQVLGNAGLMFSYGRKF
jgi:hypothetical protein